MGTTSSRTMRVRRRLGVVAGATMLLAVGVAGSAVAVAARDAKATVATGIETLAAEAPRKVAGTLERAAADVRAGLGDDAWVDAATPSSAKTFRKDAASARKLARAAVRADQIGGVAADLAAQLAAIDRDLASARILEAAAAGADEGQLARAQRIVNRGNLLALDGRYSRAIAKYKRAWKVATAAMDAAATAAP